MSNYQEYLQRSTIQYRGYRIGQGVIKDAKGEECWMFYTSLSAPFEEVWEHGKKIIDNYLGMYEC